MRLYLPVIFSIESQSHAAGTLPDHYHHHRKLVAGNQQLCYYSILWYGRYNMDLSTFVRFPSVSALPEHQTDLVEAAEWLAARLRSAGLQVGGPAPRAGGV